MQPYVLITGAAGGVGKAFAAECASRGWNLFLTDVRANALVPLAAGLTRLFDVEVCAFACDLMDPEGREALWCEVERAGLDVSFLINVAGTEYPGPFVERSAVELRTILRLNIEAAVEMTHQALRRRREGQPLHILNVSSLAGLYPMPVKAVYAASKRFLIDFSLAVRQEVRAQGVTVTVVCPSGMPTTPRAIHGLEAQGLLGQAAMLNVGDVAAGAIDAALSGKARYIPGLFNQILGLIAPLVPPSLAAAWIWKRWQHTVEPPG
jgi:uncharacterized protein